jgi:protein phosphatase
MGVTLSAGGATDVGQVRSMNQDAYLLRDGLFAVADGMGGHAGGEVASEVALTTLEQEFTEPRSENLVAAAEAANEAVISRSRDDPELSGMGTTLCAVALVDTDDGEALALVNVGDSRIYRFHDRELDQLSRDHKLVQEMIDAGELAAEEAPRHPQRNILTRALGIESELPVDEWLVIPFAGDRFLLCSDGLYDEVSNDTIAAVLRRLADPTEAAEELVRLANGAGGSDNITVVVIDVLDDGGLVAKATAALAGEPPPPPDERGRTSSTSAAGAQPPSTRPPTSAPDRDDAPDDAPDAEEQAARRSTRRATVVTVVLAVLIVGATFAGTAWYARSGWFVGLEGDRVAIFKGRPGGVLWFDPTLEERTNVESDDVPPSRLPQLEDGKEESSLTDARQYVERLEEEGARLRARSPSTTTSTPPTTALGA